MTRPMRGTVPFPPNANSEPIRRLAADLQRFSSTLGQSSQRMTGAAQTATSTWTGKAADAFKQHTNERARTVASVAGSVGNAVPVLGEMAAAIDTAIAAYNTAVIAERAARAATPFSAPALAAALFAEGAAVWGLQAAGALCAGQLAWIEAEIAAAQFFGIDRQTFTSAKDAMKQIFESAGEFLSEGDSDALVKLLNTTMTISNTDGSSTRVSLAGLAVRSNPQIAAGLEILQGVIGAGVLLTAPPLTPRSDDRFLTDLERSGLVKQPATAGQLGKNMALLEDFQRRQGTEVDQAMAVYHSVGIAPDGSSVLNLTLPGIVPPNEAVYGDSGARNLPNAAASHLTGFGVEETALLEFVQSQGLRPGDTINISAHSQGGIVGMNLADDLITRGYKVNVVSYGSPDSPLRDGVQAFMFQNDRDPVPAARLGGDGGGVSTLHPGQRIIDFDDELAENRPLFDHHAATEYGRWIEQNSSDPRVQEFNRYLREQGRVVIDPTRSGVTVFEGPRTPSGQPVSVPEPYAVGN